MAEPNLDAIKYKRTFITEAIARIDFLGALSEINQSVPRSVANLIIKAFPILAACRRRNDHGIPTNKLTSTFDM
jgi:hypothetical protein